MAALTMTVNFIVQLAFCPVSHTAFSATLASTVRGQGLVDRKKDALLSALSIKLPPRVQRNQVLDPGEDQSHRIHPGPGQRPGGVMALQRKLTGMGGTSAWPSGRETGDLQKEAAAGVRAPRPGPGYPVSAGRDQ